MSRAAPQQQRSKDTVEKILVAADTLFAARGSVGVTTTAIAEAAGISVGALYRFFPDKHAIGQALADRYLEDAASAFAAELASVDALSKVPDGLRRVIRAAGELALAHPGYYRLTQEVRPEAADSVGHSVRTSMIETFDALLTELGSTHDPTVRRVAVRMTIETVRHTLAICPTSEPERSLVLHELEDMVVTYAERRLTTTP